jgi:hypothetical protein
MIPTARAADKGFSQFSFRPTFNHRLTQIYADKTGNNFPQGQVLGLEKQGEKG